LLRIDKGHTLKGVFYMTINMAIGILAIGIAIGAKIAEKSH